ncbi:Uncharacterised protein [Nocardia brasiliensis]|nr:Uncharacterised protein [Nocardia brasiliensis]
MVSNSAEPTLPVARLTARTTPSCGKFLCRNASVVTART